MTRILNLLFKISRYFVRAISMLQSMNIVKELHCILTKYYFSSTDPVVLKASPQMASLTPAPIRSKRKYFCY